MIRLLSLVLALSASVAGGFVQQRAQADDSPIHIVGTWKPTTLPPGYAGDDYAAKVQVFAESATRHLYALSSAPLWLAAYDLDSFAPLGSGLVPAAAATASFTDPASGDLFLAEASVPALSIPTQASVEEFGVRAGKLARVGGIDLTQDLPGMRVVGLYKAPRAARLWALATTPNGDGVTIAEIDLAAPAGSPPLTWKKTLDGCPLAMHANQAASAGIGYVAKWNALYFGCTNANGALTTSPNPRGAARLVLKGDPVQGPTQMPDQFEIFPLAGDLSKAELSFDPGGDRVLIPAYSGPLGATLYAFDARSNTYVGGVAMGNAELIQAGVDPVKGRYYGLATEPTVGLLAADTRPTPIQQGVSVPALSHYRGGATQTAQYGSIAVDSLTSRLFLRYTSTNEIVIVKDELPPYEAPATGDVDSATSNIDEVPGATEVSFSGSAQAYGARYRMVGGSDAWQFNLLGVNPNQGVVGGGTRELRFSSLDRMTVGNDESTALGITAISDQGNTQGDLGKTQLRDPQSGAAITDSPVAGWPYHQVRCVDLGGDPKDDAQPGEHTKVSCNAGVNLTMASLANTGGDGGGVVVGPTSVNATTRRDPKLGAVTDVTSIANGISVLGGVLQFGEVQTHALASAKGRPGTAKGSFSRIVKDVRLNGNPLCSGNCSDLDALAAQINSSLAGRVRVDFPNPETTAGSPGGYQTVIQRSGIEQIQEVMLNEQPADHLEVPGMIISVYQDGARPGRLVTELAAVEAEARYGISSTGGPLDIATGADVNTDGLAAVQGSTDAPVFGVTPPEAFTTKPPRILNPGGDPGGVINRAGRLIWNGLHGVGRFLPIWALLLAPIYLSARRWLLLQRSTITPGGSA